MSAQILDGKALAAEIRGKIKPEVDALKSAGVWPGLATLLVGENPASQVYIRSKHKACQEVGIRSFNLTLSQSSTNAEVMRKVEDLNADPQVHGILVQLPLPLQIDSNAVLSLIHPDKDVDGFHPQNLGRLFSAKDARDIFSAAKPIPVPCTPQGVIALIHKTGVPIAGRNAVVVGRSVIVGKPVFSLLLAHHATVTIAHSQTPNLAAVCRDADLLVVAIGIANKITGNMVKPGAVVVDVGMNRLAAGGLCGDVDFETAKETAGWITPVPGGVGPMTIVMLLQNTLLLAKNSCVAA